MAQIFTKTVDFKPPSSGYYKPGEMRLIIEESNVTATSRKISWKLQARRTYGGDYENSHTSNASYSVTIGSYSTGTVSFKFSMRPVDGYTINNWYTQASGSFTASTTNGKYSVSCSAKITTPITFGSASFSSATVTGTTATTYTITYNANGGSGAPSSQTKSHGVGLVLSSTKPTRTGYNFTSWKSTRSDGTTYYYQPGETATYNGNQTLYAQWSKKTYTVKYDANGGSGAPSSQTKTYGVTLTLSSTKPTRTGYNFVNWRSVQGSTAYYFAPGETTTYNGSQTMVAQWEKKTYTVSYDANGGSGAPSSQTKTYGVDLKLSSTKPTRTGYDFLYWKTVQGSNTYYFAPGETTVYNGNQTMVAQWEKKTYTVTYNANGGSGAPSSQTKTYGVDLKLSSTKPTRTGYNFLYWNTASDGSGSTTYYAGGTKTTNSSVTLYAQWEKKTYTVSYNANGGSGAPASQTKTYGTALTLSSTKPTRTGYNFDSWNRAQDGSSGSYQPGEKYTREASATMYAQWEAKTYTITYDANGGSGAPASQTKTHGVPLILSKTKPTKSGYTFVGWGITATDTVPTAYPGDPYTREGGRSYYAIWEVTNNKSTIDLNKEIAVLNNSIIVKINSLDSTNTHKIVWSSGSNTYTSHTAAKGNVEVTLSESTFSSWFGSTDKNISIKVTVSTYNSGGTLLGSDIAAFTLVLPGALARPGRPLAFISNNPEGATIHLNNLSLKFGATFSRWVVSTNGGNVEIAGDVITATIEDGVNQNYIMTIQAEDSRGYRSVPMKLVWYARRKGACVYQNGAWTSTVPYVYKGGQWVKQESYIYKNSKWNESK